MHGALAADPDDESAAVPAMVEVPLAVMDYRTPVVPPWDPHAHQPMVNPVAKRPLCNHLVQDTMTKDLITT